MKKQKKQQLPQTQSSQNQDQFYQAQYKLLKYAKRNWKMLSLSIMMTLTCGILQSFIPWEISKVLDILTSVQQDPFAQEAFKSYCLALTITIFAFGIFTFSRIMADQQVQQLIAVDMRSDIFETFLHNDLKFYEKYKSGDLISRLGNDITQAKLAISSNLTFFMRNVLSIFINVLVIFIMNWKLTLMIMSTVPLFALIGYFYNKNNKIYTKDYQDILAEMSAHASQKFKGISVVKTYCTEKKQSQHYRQINNKGYEVMTKRNIWFTIFISTNLFLPYISILIVIWFGGLSTLTQADEGLTIGKLTAFILYCNNLVTNTSAISQGYSNITTGIHAMQKVFEMLEYVPEVDERVGLNLPINGDITFKNVDFKYPNSEVNVLTNLSLKINKGQYVAFVGPSGSGKSTIVKLLQRLYKISKGYIYFDDHNAEDINTSSLRSQIGLVSQEPILFSGSIKDNITYGLDNFTEQEVYEAAQKAGCLQFLKNKTLFPEGFETQLGENGVNLSGGQKQRLAIARALIRKPKILIFDEATSALDAHSQAIIQKSIENIAYNEKALTIIVIAHRLSTIINASRIIMLKHGKIVQEGTHQVLTKNKGEYYQLVQKQFHERDNF